MNLLQFLRFQCIKSTSFFSRYVFFLRDFTDFHQMNQNDGRFTLYFQDQYPCLSDNTETTGFDAHYIYHPAWAARIVKHINPKKHIDISSTLTFCSILSAFVPVDFYDYRPAHLHLSNLHSKKGDLLHLPFPSQSVESLSCMHTIEHIGLGRYGDPLDAQGDLKGIAELKRVVKLGGSLIFVVPIGKPRIRFNAHRIYSYEQVMKYFDGFSLKEFTLLSDDTSKGLKKHAKQKLADEQVWGCGCFWFIKK